MDMDMDIDTVFVLFQKWLYPERRLFYRRMADYLTDR